MDLKKKLEKCSRKRDFCRAGGEAIGSVGSIATTIGAALIGIGYIFALVTDHYDKKIYKLNNNRR